jgi:hypothetical protein
VARGVKLSLPEGSDPLYVSLFQDCNKYQTDERPDFTVICDRLDSSENYQNNKLRSYTNK